MEEIYTVCLGNRTEDPRAECFLSYEELLVWLRNNPYAPVLCITKETAEYITGTAIREAFKEGK